VRTLQRGAWQGSAISAFLITGNPGSGKTTIARELTRRGLIAVDADDTAHWETSSGVPVSQPQHTTDEWLLGHRWVWSRARIEAAIRPHVAAGRHIFLCGIAMNQRDMFDLFTTVFLLSIDHATQLRGSTRRTTRSGTQPRERRSSRAGRRSSAR
jgi:hypothetical protein